MHCGTNRAGGVGVAEATWAFAVGEPRPLRIAYLSGSDAHTGVQFGDHFTGSKGSTDLYRLGMGGPGGFERLHFPRNYFRQPYRHDLGRFDVLLNLVTEPDQSPKVLQALARLVKGFRGRVINRPEHVLRSTRDQVSQACRGLPHVIAPQVLRLASPKARVVRRKVEESEIRFPAILRRAGTHGGRIAALVERPQQLDTLLDGGDEHFLTEFVDFRSADGLYRKYRFFCIGDWSVLRHMLVSDAWNVHAKDRIRFMSGKSRLIEEERHLFSAGVDALPPAFPIAHDAICNAMKLHFFGMDFGFDREGNLVLFEANPAMGFFANLDHPEFGYVKSCLRPAQLAFNRLLFRGARRLGDLVE